MKHRDEDLDRVLDRTLEQIREEQPDRQVEQEASARVWQLLSHELDSGEQQRPKPRRIQSCEDFQALLPEYLAGELARARHLLLQDHLGECITCHRALKEQRQAVQHNTAPRPERSSNWFATMGWRVAAAAVIFLALVGVSFKTSVFSFESGGLIKIESIEGELFRISGEESAPLKVGDVLTLEEGQGIRTAKGSSAVVRLADNSQVEMRERSQLAVLERNYLLPGRRSDGLLELERGAVIVEASDQGSGHLFVNTDDAEVTVTGTVFSVSHGMRGSRISVIEGEVHVRHAGTEDVLMPGQQTNTSRSLGRVPVADDVAWSRNGEEYAELLREVRALGEQIDQVLSPGLRYGTELLEIAPANTVVYIGMPNISEELGQAYEILQSRMASSEVLRQWWEQQVMEMGGEGHLEEVIEKMRAFGDHLEEEIIMTVQMSEDSQASEPLFLARVSSPGSFMDLLADEIGRLEQTYEEDLDMVLIKGALPPTPPGGSSAGLFVWTQGDVLAMTPSFESLRALDAVLQKMEGTSLAGTAFGERLGEMYADGVEWAVGVDLERLMGAAHGDQETLESLGLGDVQYVIAERKQVDGRTENSAELTFDQPRRRIAAWLAEPAPMGALDYVSPDASLAAGFVMKDMGVLVDELFDFIGEFNPDFTESLDRFETEEGIDIRRDFAKPLGGEFVVALDGPVLPMPSWKLVMEVYDPIHLVQTLKWTVERINQEAAQSGTGPALEFEWERVGGRDYLSIGSASTGLAAHFVIDGGYVIAGPSRALLDRTLQNHSLGIRLTDSPKFRDLLPRDQQVNFSGVIYQNLAPVLAPLTKTLGVIDLGDMQRQDTQMLASLAGDAKPSLAVFYGLEDSIYMASCSEGGLFTSGLASLSGFGGLLGVQQSLARAVEREVQSR